MIFHLQGLQYARTFTLSHWGMEDILFLDHCAIYRP